MRTGLDRFVAEFAVKLRISFKAFMLILRFARFIYGKKEIYFAVRKNALGRIL
jgi:hypothetical protein